MPRNAERMGRPHDHLLSAAAAHERIVAGEAHRTDGPPDAELVAKAEEKSERVKRQPRRDGGRFA